MRKIIFTYVLILFTLISYAQKQDEKNIVRGQVLQSETEKPLKGVSVIVLKGGMSTLTDENGFFELVGVKSGYQRLYIYGFELESIISESFLVSSVAPTELSFSLARLSVDAGDVVVMASPFKSTIESPISVRKIGVEEIDLTPGANRDISKVVQLSAGVVPISFGNRNDILVRGGGANENRYYIDGIEIPVLNHFSVQGGSGGYASLVNTELLGGVNFYTGAFPSEFSNGLSSVLEMKMKKANTKKFHGKLIVGASDVGININTPISKKGKTTLLASYRRSYLQLLFSALGLPFLPTYNDYQFKINSEISEKDEIYFIGLGSFDNNKLNLSADRNDDLIRYIEGYLPNNDQVSNVFGLGHKHKFKKFELRTIFSRNYLNNKLYKYENNNTSLAKALDISNRETEYKFRSEVKFNDLGGFIFKAGVGGGYGKMNGSTFQKKYIDNNLQTLTFDSDIDLWRYSLYSTVSRDIIEGKLFSSLSLRADAMTYSSKTDNPLKNLSPRFSIMYHFAPKWSLSGSVGRYYQEPTYTTMSIEENKSRLKYMTVNSYDIGLDYSINNNSKVKVETFYKQYGNIPISLLDSLPISTADLEASVVGAVPASSIGKGRAYGVEVTYRNLDFKNTIINFSYSFFRSETNNLDKNMNPIKGEYTSSSWDVRHVLNISAIHKFKRNWTLGMKWYMVGGLPYTPYDYELSSQIDAWDAQNRPYLDTDKYNTERYKLYHQLDIRVDKTFYFNKWRLGFYIDIQNVYNKSVSRQNLLIPEVDINGNNIIDVDDPTKYKMKEVESSFGGTILPTFGLTFAI